MAKNIHDLSLLDIAPSSIVNDNTVRNVIHAIDPELHAVSEAVCEDFIISRIGVLPEPVLDLLAWQWHVDFYELANSIEAKRDLVKNSINWHRHKGTRGAILKALEMLGVEAKFTAWYDDEDNKNNPYTFAIDAKLTGNFWERVDWTKPTQTIRRAILESKAARSYMSKLYVHYENQSENHTYILLGLSQGIEHNIALYQSSGAEGALKISAGLALSQGIEHEIGLRADLAGISNGALYTKIGLSQSVFYEIGINKNRSASGIINSQAVNSASQGIYHEIDLK